MTGTKWKDAELEVLARLYPTEGKHAVSAALAELGFDRNPDAIAAHARRVGLYAAGGRFRPNPAEARTNGLDDLLLALLRRYHPCPLYVWDVAEELEIPRGTARSSLNRAIKRGDVARYVDPNAPVPVENAAPYLYRLTPKALS